MNNPLLEWVFYCLEKSKMTQESRLVIVIDSKNAERNARNLANELDSIERNGDYATKSMDKLSVATRQLAGYMAGVVTVGAAINKMDLYTGINNKLKLVTNSQEELNRAMTDTFDIAQRSASSWSAVNDVYSKYMSNAKTLNLTQAQTAKLTEITSKAVAISGSNAESAAAALFQYGQALDGGVLRAEEFNSLVDGAGGLLNAMAKGLGVTRGELRQMMLDGKLTGEVITKALLQAGDSVEELYGKTDKTIGQSLEMLSNGITKFVGETGKGSGAAQTLSGSIQVLANNLDLLVNGAVVAGIGLITKAVLTKTVAIQASIAASAQQRAANLAEAQSQVQLLGVEAMRARQAAALALTEIGLARAEYNAATTANARAAAIQRKTAAEIAHSIALKEATAATMAYTVAQGNLNRVATLGSRALGLVGGPINAIALGITALAAGYMYFQDKAAQANKKLEEQASVAKKAKEELLALRGLEKDSAINDMATSFERQNKALAESSSKINIQLNAIAQLYKGNKEIVQVVNDATDGTISMNEAVKRFNDLRISKEIYNSLKENTKEFEKNAKEAKTTKDSLKLFGIEVELSGKKAQTAVAGIDENSKALIGNESAAQKATKAQKGYFDSLRNDVLNSNEELAYLNLGYSEEVVKKIKELEKAKQAVAPAGTTVIVTNEEIAQIITAQKALDALKEKKDAIIEAEKKHTSELEKQQKIMAVNAQVKANASKYNFSNLESKYELLPGLLSAINMQESKGKASAIGPQTEYGTAKGGFQMLDDTAKRWGLVGKEVFDTGKAAEAAAKYLNFLFKKFGNWDKAISAYHAGEGNVEKGTNIGPVNRQYVKNVKGYVAGNNGFDMAGVSEKDFDSYLNQFLKTQEEAENLRNQYLDKDTLAEKEHLKTLSDLKLHFKGEELKSLTAKEVDHFNAQKQLNAQQLEYELNEYKLNEVQKLEMQKQTKLLQIKASKEYSDTEKEIRSKAVTAMFDYEIAEYRKLQKQKLEEYQKAMYDQASIAQADVLNLKAKKTLTPDQLDSWNLQNQYSDDMQKANESYSSTAKSISEDKTIVDEEKRFQALLDAEELFRQQKFAINEKYTLMEQELQKSSRQTEIEIYGQLLSQASSVWGNMTAMVKESAGEQSAAYKAMFLVQQAMAMGTATIQAYQAYSNVLANAPYPLNMTMAPIALGLGMANVGLIAAQTIAGFSDGGYTGNGLKHTPAGVVHKGEVVWSQEDIKRWGGVGVVESMRTSSPSGYANGGYVSNNQSDAIATRRETRQFDAINSNNTNTKPSGDISISQTITFTNDGSAQVDTQGQKEIAQSLNSMMNSWARRESMQGGVLYKIVRGSR